MAAVAVGVFDLRLRCLIVNVCVQELPGEGEDGRVGRVGWQPESIGPELGASIVDLLRDIFLFFVDFAID